MSRTFFTATIQENIDVNVMILTHVLTMELLKSNVIAMRSYLLGLKTKGSLQPATDLLPISAVMYGPLSFDIENANFTIGPLRCSGKSIQNSFTTER